MERSLVWAGHATARVKASLLAAVCCGVLAVPIGSYGQVVTPKTLPVLQAGQFDMVPSDRGGMAGVTIAVDDTLLDPFVNPAKASRISGGHVFSSPYFHNVSGGRGGGRSLPLGGAGSWGGWSATGLFTFQQLDRVPPNQFFFGCPVCAERTVASPSSTSGRSAFNEYVAGSIARRVTPSTSVGLGVQFATLQAIDGVDLLYAGSDRIAQSGHLADFRLGMTKELGPERAFELLALHSRTDMRHDVHFTTWRWDPVANRSIVEERQEVNEDQTHIWGLHSEYSRPLGSEGWHVGWLGTVNRLSHPKIPNYSVQNVPRDPGTTYSFNAGTGIGRTKGRTTIGADLIYEPMFADTWADAANDTAIVGGGTIKAGAKTVENTFRFNNLRMRLGAGEDIKVRRDGNATLGYQVGLDLYAIKYRLQQANHVQRTFRTQHEQWLEWSPTFGLRLSSHELDVRYNFSLTCGPGACGGSTNFPVAFATPDALSSGGIIAAPSGELFMQSGALKIHKLTIVVPIH